jgi:hypothetical protein
MKTALRLACGLLLIVSAVGCHTCHHSCGDQACQPRRSCLHKSCLHKLFKGRGGCGCNSGCGEGCGGSEGEMACDCGHHRHHHKSKVSYDLPAEAMMHGYDKTVVYTGDDWQGIPQPVMGGMMPMSVGCAGCAGGPPMMSMPPVGCAGCAGSGMSPIPGDGGCASCAGTGVAPQPATSGCASCGGNPANSTPATPPTGGSCASCGAGASADSFYNPMGPHHVTPAPAPPADPAPPIESVPGGEKSATSGNEPIQKIHWVPRQL